MLNPSLHLANFTKEEGEALTRELEDLDIVLEEEGIWAEGEMREGKMSADQEHHKKPLMTSSTLSADYG